MPRLNYRALSVVKVFASMRVKKCSLFENVATVASEHKAIRVELDLGTSYERQFSPLEQS